MEEKTAKVQRYHFLYRIVRINDSPLRISIGFGLGVFTAVIPGIGPIAALLLAFIFRVNRASAVLGSILFNTWFSFVALLMAIKTGSAVAGLDHNDVYNGWTGLIKDFKWEKLFEVSVYQVLVPIAIGYLIIALVSAIIAGVIVYGIARFRKLQKFVDKENIK